MGDQHCVRPGSLCKTDTRGGGVPGVGSASFHRLSRIVQWDGRTISRGQWVRVLICWLKRALPSWMGGARPMLRGLRVQVAARTNERCGAARVASLLDKACPRPGDPNLPRAPGRTRMQASVRPIRKCGHPIGPRCSCWWRQPQPLSARPVPSRPYFSPPLLPPPPQRQLVGREDICNAASLLPGRSRGGGGPTASGHWNAPVGLSDLKNAGIPLVHPMVAVGVSFRRPHSLAHGGRAGARARGRVQPTIVAAEPTGQRPPPLARDAPHRAGGRGVDPSPPSAPPPARPPPPFPMAAAPCIRG